MGPAFAPIERQSSLHISLRDCPEMIEILFAIRLQDLVSTEKSSSVRLCAPCPIFKHKLDRNGILLVAGVLDD